MDAQIVKDAVLSIIREKVDFALARGIYRANYDEVLRRLAHFGYSEEEIRPAIVELVRTKQLKTGKTPDGVDDNGQPKMKGWLRDYREIDKEDDLRPK